MAVVIAKRESDMVIALFSKWALRKCQQVFVLNIEYLTHSMVIAAHNWTIDYCSSRKINEWKEENKYHQERYCNVQKVQNVICGWWSSEENDIQLLNSDSGCVTWIYTQTHWTTCRPPAQLRGVWGFPSNSTQSESSGVLMIWTGNLANVWVPPGSGHTVTAWQHG